MFGEKLVQRVVVDAELSSDSRGHELTPVSVSPRLSQVGFVDKQVDEVQ
jgi:hypothetical protein